MCGIVGYAGFHLPKKNSDKALELIEHRGPDGSGEAFISNQTPGWFGHRRLAIVDLTEMSAQPMKSNSGRFLLTYNGEIYNSPDIRSELRSRGVDFHTEGDTEVLLQAFAYWGLECLDKLEGMFAFALWDNRRKTLTLCRDRLGMKPLYYSPYGRGVSFSSEATSLVALLENHKDIALSADGMAYCMAHGYIPSPYTIWEGVYKLRPGHYLQWDGISQQLGSPTEYWSPPKSTSLGKPGEYSNEEFSALFNQVCSEHTISDVPVGLFLSGGNDSIAVASSFADTQKSSSVTAYTLGFENVPDETSVAAKAAGQLGLAQVIKRINQEQIEELVLKTVALYDEPLLYSAILSMNQLCSFVGTQSKVVLAGDGGDEVFCGYQWYRNLSEVPDRSKNHFLNYICDSIAANIREPFRYYALNFLQRQRSNLHSHSWKVLPRYLPKEIDRLFAPLGMGFNDKKSLAPFEYYDEPDMPIRRRLQRIDLMTYSADLCCAKIDRASMAYGLEVRTPFLDRRIVEWGLSMPENDQEEWQGKPVVKRFLKGKVSDDIIYKEKSGFSVPITEYLDQEFVYSRVESGVLNRQGFLDKKLLRELSAPNIFSYSRLWQLYMLDCWIQSVFAKLGKPVRA